MTEKPGEPHEPSLEDEMAGKLRNIQEAKLSPGVGDVSTTEDELAPIPEIHDMDSHPSLEEIDAEFQTRLKELDAKAHASKQKYEEEKARKEAAMKDDQSSNQGLANGLAGAYTLMGTVMVCIGIGWALDHFLGTKGLLNWGAIIGSVLGLWAMIWVLNRNEK